ncbi:MAG: hypothetical protein C0485_07920 [Pirellula sp.]|nr:hypothetical protein [Pirellula sp.]
MKPSKPRPDFPLTANGNGQWSKKIRGKVHYFGAWADPQAAYESYLEKRDYLQAGLAPPQECDTLGHLLDAFLDTKRQALEIGEISQRTFGEYESVCDTIADTIGTRRVLEGLTFADFTSLRQKLSVKKNGEPASPVSLKRLLTFARMPFYFANEEFGKTIRYKKPLQTPPARMLREARRKVGERLFTAEEIRKIVKASKEEMRAMILLGINCGFGPGDCRQLTIESVDLEKGFHNFPRPKTAVSRRCPLWPGTITALRAVIGDRSTGTVFKPTWNRHVVARVFQAGCMGTGVYREGVTTFYSLRRTFETVACAGDTPQHVIDSIMGHALRGSDMAGIYRQRVFDDMLRKCTDFVRGWVTGEIVLN